MVYQNWQISGIPSGYVVISWCRQKDLSLMGWGPFWTLSKKRKHKFLKRHKSRIWRIFRRKCGGLYQVMFVSKTPRPTSQPCIKNLKCEIARLWKYKKHLWAAKVEIQIYLSPAAPVVTNHFPLQGGICQRSRESGMEICHIITKSILVSEKNSFNPRQENPISHDQDPE